MDAFPPEKFLQKIRLKQSLSYFSLTRLTSIQSIIAVEHSIAPAIPNPTVIMASGRLKYLVVLNKWINIKPAPNATSSEITPGIP